MLAKLRNTFQTISRRNNFSKVAWPPKISIVEQTKLSWAKHVSPDTIPDIFKEFFDTHLVGGREFPYSVLTPSYEGFMHRATEKLICDFGREIYILERKGNSFEVLCFPVDGISYVEVRTILLDSYINTRELCFGISAGQVVA